MRERERSWQNTLPESTQVDQLRFLFSSFGVVLDVLIPASSRRGRGRCFGFLTFKERSISFKAVDAMDGYSLGGRRMTDNIAKYGMSDINKKRREEPKGRAKDSFSGGPVPSFQVCRGHS